VRDLKEKATEKKIRGWESQRVSKRAGWSLLRPGNVEGGETIHSMRYGKYTWTEKEKSQQQQGNYWGRRSTGELCQISLLRWQISKKKRYSARERSLTTQKRGVALDVQVKSSIGGGTYSAATISTRIRDPARNIKQDGLLGLEDSQVRGKTWPREKGTYRDEGGPLRESRAEGNGRVLAWPLDNWNER